MTTTSLPDPSRGRESERRRFHRFLAQPSDIQVHVGSKTIKGELVNESIGGLALTTYDASNIMIGQAVEANLREASSTAYVRSIHKRMDGKYRVGVSWEKKSQQKRNAVADYLAHEDLFLVCEIVCDQSGPVRMVRLWDGAEFEVMADDLYERTYEERRDELNAAPTKLPTLAQLYGLHSNIHANGIVAEILNFEFSSPCDTATS